MGWRSAGTVGLLVVLTASGCGGGTTSDVRARDLPGSTAEPTVAATQAEAPIDWTSQPYPECGDLPPQVVSTIAGDLDGDGAEDAVVGVQCETVTAGAPNLVVAFLLDGPTGAVADREVLVTQCSTTAPCDPGVRDEHLVGDLELAIVDGVVQIASKAYSDEAPLCCPDREVHLRFEWTGQDFDQVVRGE